MTNSSTSGAVRFFQVSDDLKTRARNSLAFDDKTLKSAEHAVSRFLDNHRDWCANELEGFNAFMERMEEREQLDSSEMDILFKFADSLRNNGGMFGYDLLTEIGKSLCWFLADRDVDDISMQIIRLHIDGMAIVLAHDLKGDGGETGRSLIEDLRGVVASTRDS